MSQSRIETDVIASMLMTTLTERIAANCESLNEVDECVSILKQKLDVMARIAKATLLGSEYASAASVAEASAPIQQRA